MGVVGCVTAVAPAMTLVVAMLAVALRSLVPLVFLVVGVVLLVRWTP
nr:hypothetical protein [Pseudodesulfovibrio sp.]